MRIKKKCSVRGLLIDVIPNSPNLHHKNYVSDTKENLPMRSLELKGFSWDNHCCSRQVHCISFIKRLTLNYKEQLFSMKKQVAGMFVHGTQCMRLNREYFPVERREHLIQHCKKCSTRQQLR